MTQSKLSLDQIFEAQIRTLALTLRPGTLATYRSAAHRFLDYLHTAFPQVRRLAQLRRDPHLLGWFRWMCEQHPPLHNATRRLRLLCLRRLLEDLAANGHLIQPDLIRREDFPPDEHYLPRPLNAADDQQLQQELRHTDDLFSNALLLTRLTGMRIGECIALPLDCLRQLGPHQWALHVPLGKLHTERLVPADPEIRRIVARMLELRAQTSPARLAVSEGWLLPRRGRQYPLYLSLRAVLADATQRASCSSRITLHQLRHTYATEMLRLGVSLPALMRLLGHKDIRMTLRYLQVTQQDVQREFHLARRNAAHPHRLPTLPIPADTPCADFPGIQQALTATRRLLEMYRRSFPDQKIRRKLQRLDRRLHAVATQLELIAKVEK
jgi:site-specific recombinase XerD